VVRSSRVSRSGRRLGLIEREARCRRKDDMAFFRRAKGSKRPSRSPRGTTPPVLGLARRPRQVAAMPPHPLPRPQPPRGIAPNWVLLRKTALGSNILRAQHFSTAAKGTWPVSDVRCASACPSRERWSEKSAKALSLGAVVAGVRGGEAWRRPTAGLLWPRHRRDGPVRRPPGALRAPRPVGECRVLHPESPHPAAPGDAGRPHRPGALSLTRTWKRGPCGRRNRPARR
jgi:hypothetical protein